MSGTKRLLLVFLTAFSPVLLTSCATVGDSVIGKVADAALESVGLKKSATPDTPKAPRTVQISLSGGANLNASQNQPLAVVVKIYKLSNANTFMQAPLSTLTDTVAEKAFLGADLLEQRDVTLLPGQHYAFAEKVAGEVNAIGVVALFHSPAPRRWKFVFDAASAEKTGISLGIHGCAMTVVSGEVVTPPGELKEEALNQLSLVKCSKSLFGISSAAAKSPEWSLFHRLFSQYPDIGTAKPVKSDLTQVTFLFAAEIPNRFLIKNLDQGQPTQ